MAPSNDRTTPLRDGAWLVVLALLTWAACGATMFAGLALGTTTSALVVHALLAPVYAGLAAFAYFRRAPARLSPSTVAMTIVGLVIFLDAFVVALLIERSFAMFQSFLGTWLPFASMFLSSWIVGSATRARWAYRDEGAERRAVDAFLAQRRLAFVGLSTDPKAFSRVVYDALVAQGYDIVPINPTASTVDGRASYPRLQDVPESVDAVLIMTPADRSAAVVRDCVDTGVKHVWLHRGVGPGAVSEEALALCDEHALEVVRGQCPLMFLPDAAGFHRTHGYIKKLAGTYPR